MTQKEKIAEIRELNDTTRNDLTLLKFHAKMLIGFSHERGKVLPLINEQIEMRPSFELGKQLIDQLEKDHGHTKYKKHFDLMQIWTQDNFMTLDEYSRKSRQMTASGTDPYVCVLARFSMIDRFELLQETDSQLK